MSSFVFGIGLMGTLYFGVNQQAEAEGQRSESSLKFDKYLDSTFE